MFSFEGLKQRRLLGSEDGQSPDVQGCQERLLYRGRSRPYSFPWRNGSRVKRVGLFRGVSKHYLAENSPEQEKTQAVKIGPGMGSKRSAGAGNRGGNWNNSSSNSRVSDRNNAANVNSGRNNNNGGRACKTFSIGEK